jgi:hypothetical protein
MHLKPVLHYSDSPTLISEGANMALTTVFVSTRIRPDFGPLSEGPDLPD